MKDIISYHPAPVWLTKEYLEPVLRALKKDNELQVLQMQVKPVTAKGENYASIMTRLSVEFLQTQSEEKHCGSYIVKTSYEHNPFAFNIFKEYDIYKTEMLMYEKVLPRLTELLHETGDKDKLFADTIHVDYKNSAIIFEDLTPSQFITADRLAGMDMLHAKLSLKKLAKMHATAAVLNERTQGSLQKFDRGIFNRHTAGFQPFFFNMFTVCAQFAGECKELGAYYEKKLMKLRHHVMEHATRVYDHHEGHFHTLNHGDYWINNVMLRYGKNNASNNVKAVQDILIIDFQFCCWASPAVDLHYFFNTSLQADLRLHNEDELVQHYHKHLSKTLRELKYQAHIPSLHDFCVQLEAGRFYAVFSAIVSQALMINDKTDDADFDALMADDERAHNFRKLLYQNTVVQENMKKLLPIFDRKGLLDIFD